MWNSRMIAKCRELYKKEQSQVGRECSDIHIRNKENSYIIFCNKEDKDMFATRRKVVRKPKLSKNKFINVTKKIGKKRMNSQIKTEGFLVSHIWT